MAEVVNTPPIEHGLSETSMARSSLSSPRVLRPMKTPPAENPRGDVMVPFGMAMISALAGMVKRSCKPTRFGKNAA